MLPNSRHTAQVQPAEVCANRVITKQPSTTKEGFAANMLSLGIINAHEFKPHENITALAAFDTLLVVEETRFIEAVTGLERSNKYKVMTKNGSQLYEVNEGRFDVKSLTLTTSRVLTR